MWYSIIPALNFSDMHIHFLARKEHFKKFVDECLKYRELGKRYIDTSITRKFSLQIRRDDRSTLADKWLNFVVKNKVAELDLCMIPWCNKMEMKLLLRTACPMSYLMHNL